MAEKIFGFFKCALCHKSLPEKFFAFFGETGPVCTGCEQKALEQDALKDKEAQ